jgi:uncharacterized protein
MTIGKLKIRFLNEALVVDDEILVIGDVHIGYEEYALGENLFSRTQFKEIIEKLDIIFDYLEKVQIKIKQIVILGDLKHEFGKISDSEWRETLKFLDYLLKKTQNIKLIRGNHDNILGPIAGKKGVEILDYYKVRINSREVCFLHGDKVYGNCLKSDVLIIGHLHPAITFYDRYKKEKFKCFLKGKWKRDKKEKEVYILPSFIPLVWGYDINELRNLKGKEKFSIIDGKTLKKFEVIIYNEKEHREYNFGRLEKLMKKQG